MNAQATAAALVRVICSPNSSAERTITKAGAVYSRIAAVATVV
jgi:hypothetical protein